MVNSLVVIVSCRKNQQLWPKLLDRHIPNSIILCGDSDVSYVDGKILHLKCSDAYEGLSEKMMCAFEFLTKCQLFDEYTHILKADDHDTDFTAEQITEIQRKHKDILTSKDYIGQNLISERMLGRRHHFGRVAKDSIWYNREYSEVYKPYLGGGQTYILSRKALECLVAQKEETVKYILEDAMMGALLYNCNIHPLALNYGIRCCG